MSTIILDANRELLTGDQYLLTWIVASHNRIDPEIFMHRVDGDVYSHVATAWDMLEYPAEPVASLDFYRMSSASIVTANIDNAVALIDITKNKVDILVEDYEKVINDFVGSETSSHTF